MTQDDGGGGGGRLNHRPGKSRAGRIRNVCREAVAVPAGRRGFGCVPHPRELQGKAWGITARRHPV